MAARAVQRPLNLEELRQKSRDGEIRYPLPSPAAAERDDLTSRIEAELAARKADLKRQSAKAAALLILTTAKNSRAKAYDRPELCNSRRLDHGCEPVT